MWSDVGNPSTCRSARVFGTNSIFGLFSASSFLESEIYPYYENRPIGTVRVALNELNFGFVYGELTALILLEKFPCSLDRLFTKEKTSETKQVWLVEANV